MEEEFTKNQERQTSIDELREQEITKVESLRGTPLEVGDLEKIIDDDHAILAPHEGLEYYTPILYIEDKD